jgi:hypothetical protein
MQVNLWPGDEIDSSADKQETTTNLISLPAHRKTKKPTRTPRESPDELHIALAVPRTSLLCHSLIRRPRLLFALIERAISFH